MRSLLNRPTCVAASFAILVASGSGCAIHNHYSLLDASKFPATSAAVPDLPLWWLGAIVISAAAVGAGLFSIFSRRRTTETKRDTPALDQADLQERQSAAAAGGSSLDRADAP